LAKQEKNKKATQKNVQGQEEELKLIKEKLEKEVIMNKQLDESLQIV
jgi:hypothetical protein